MKEKQLDTEIKVKFVENYALIYIDLSQFDNIFQEILIYNLKRILGEERFVIKRNHLILITLEKDWDKGIREFNKLLQITSDMYNEVIEIAISKTKEKYQILN